jgi:diaminohydroxyphosphoribosylaminopyrimidine deaminase / 5-amino-6-(5-phosphoribosylamino)uracil reductase
MNDERFMARAVELAGQGRGATAPNPCVGAVLASRGRIVAEGWHQRVGAAHAEVNCLAQARDKGFDPSLATLYVTLEPCSHHGRTPPCTEAVLGAGIREVVIGCLDPNPDVSGQGARILARAGVKVRLGVLGQACRDLIGDFLVWRFTPRTFNTLKLASTLDGRIAARDGRPAWISGPESRAAAHEMRSRVGAVLVGGATLRQDNPRLTARPECGEPAEQPLAVVVTGNLPAPGAELNLLRERPGRAVFWTGPEQAGSPRAAALRAAGCRVLALPARDRGLSLAEGFVWLRRSWESTPPCARAGAGWPGAWWSRAWPTSSCCFWPRASWAIARARPCSRAGRPGAWTRPWPCACPG